MKKVVILFELEDWELKPVLEEGFSGEIYTLEDFQSHDEALSKLREYQDVVIITKWYHDEPYNRCPCSEGYQYFTYHQYLGKADVVHQCSECGFEWKKVRSRIDAFPEQLSFLPTVLNGADGFKRIFP